IYCAVAHLYLPSFPTRRSSDLVVATLIPASPLNLWIHLSPIPNLIGSAVLPGALAGAASLWSALLPRWVPRAPDRPSGGGPVLRSEEHTSELQSRFDLVCRLVL